MATKNLDTLRARVRAAIEKDGIGAVSTKTGCLSSTLWRFVSGVGRTQRGTLRLIEDAYGTNRLQGRKKT